MSPTATMWLIGVFLIVFGQQQRNKVYQALDTHDACELGSICWFGSVRDLTTLTAVMKIFTDSKD